MVKVVIKWGKEVIRDLEWAEGETFLEFKAKIYALTLVPTDKQKVIYKGSVLKEDVSLESLKLPENANLMLMGAAEGEKKLTEPAQKIVFIEDLTPEERAKILKEKKGIVLPTGLVNLGNTCYLNSSIQCLKRINEFKEFFINNKAPSTQSIEGRLAFSMQSLIKQLERKGESFEPVDFVRVFMQVFPQFSEKTPQGVFKQQDADECFQNLLNYLEVVMYTNDMEGDKINLIKDLFELNFEVRIKNKDIPEEPEQIKEETSRKMLCIIDNQSNPINHLHEGIAAGLEEDLQKTSELDNQSHIYSKTLRLNKLPKYMIVQMVRFFWKKNPNGEGTKAKILRNVSFPKILDVYPFCNDLMKKTIDQGREYEKKQIEEKNKVETDKFEEYKKKLESEGKIVPEDSRELFKKFKEQMEEESIKTHDDALYRKHGLGLDTGNYQLIGVLTHKGRSADSGHYVAWIHHSGDIWLKYDDDLVTEVKIDDILNLRGGGDWHMAYYCIYRKLEIL